MSAAGKLAMYGRFARDLPGFLRRRISLAESLATVERRLEQREENFLRLAERGIFGYPRSPYLSLLALAGCEMGDLRRLVQDDGLEGALRALRSAGVYVSFEEFKGRTPMVRDGRELAIAAGDFDNPFLSPHYQTATGGTTGPRTRMPQDLNHLVATVPANFLACYAHGVLGAPVGLWRGVLPDGTGLNNVLRGVLMANVPRRWFSPIASADLRPTLKYRLATGFVLSTARLSGAPVPWPELLRLDQAGKVARWAAETVAQEGACLVLAGVSMALRVSIASRDEGIDLTGVTFMGGGEPPTAAKVQGITQTGARWVPKYVFVEGGCVGIGCAAPVDGNDLHFCRDALALIQHLRRVPGTELMVPAFCFTTLLPTAPRLLLNVEIDDFGVLERRSCGCPLENVGYDEHIREVRSFSKLTGEGVTLIGGEMIQILEEVLPARFGGTALDYQLLEEEDEQGFTRLSLVVSPRVRVDDDRAFVQVVLEELARRSMAADLARAIWSQAGTLRVERKEPIWTARGKLMPLHSSRRA